MHDKAIKVCTKKKSVQDKNSEREDSVREKDVCKIMVCGKERRVQEKGVGKRRACKR